MTSAQRTVPRSNEECTNSFMSGGTGTAKTGLASHPERVTARTLDIANRLRFVCAHLEADELLALAARMAAVEVKYARADAEHRAKRQSASPPS